MVPGRSLYGADGLASMATRHASMPASGSEKRRLALAAVLPLLLLMDSSVLSMLSVGLMTDTATAQSIFFLKINKKKNNATTLFC